MRNLLLKHKPITACNVQNLCIAIFYEWETFPFTAMALLVDMTHLVLCTTMSHNVGYAVRGRAGVGLEGKARVRVECRKRVGRGVE